mgnify:CR=1 FL=1
MANNYRRNYKYNITMFNENYKSVVLDSEDTTGITYYTNDGYKPVKNKEVNSILEDKSLLKLNYSIIASNFWATYFLSSSLNGIFSK